MQLLQSKYFLSEPHQYFIVDSLLPSAHEVRRRFYFQFVIGPAWRVGGVGEGEGDRTGEGAVRLLRFTAGQLSSIQVLLHNSVIVACHNVPITSILIDFTLGS